MKDLQPNRDHINDLSWMNKYDNNVKIKLQEKHDKKINALKISKKTMENKKKINRNIDTTNVLNKSNIQLTEYQLQVLSKGLKFAQTPNTINVVDIIANVESSLCTVPTIPKITKQLAISEITTFVKQWKKPKMKENNISKEEQIALKELKNNNKIIITQADKGGKVVVMDRVEYIRKIEEKLNDTSTYEEVKDPTNMIKSKITELTNRLYKNNKISLNLKHEFSSIDNLPSIRGQPKLHKADHPMRLITCTKNTILSPLSKHAFTFIKELRNTIKNTICNTSQFINNIYKVKLEKDDNMISLDVQDLFTNIPVTRAIDIAINKIGNSEKFCMSNLTITDLKQILLISLNNSYCEFNGKFYKQKHGLPMGNTLSPLLADLYMNYYMDNKMDENEIESYVKDLNKIRSKIKFTHEYEKNGEINFLDTTLSKTQDGNIEMKWYRKDSAADRLLNYNSYHDKSVKINIIKNMTSRIIETSKNPIQQEKDLKILKQILTKSDYPEHIIEKYIMNT
ncbi:unnamed protein product, partial [Rotaria sordida]